MATSTNFSNQSILSYYCSPTLGNAVDWMTGRSYLENKLSCLVNGATVEDPQKMSALRQKLFNNESTRYVSIPKKNGLILDGVLFNSKEPTKGAIFLVLGSAGYYEKTADPEDLASHFVNFFKASVGNDIDILIINPQEIGETKGTASYQEWVSDIQDGIQYLLLGYEAKHILVYGHSLGGWIAADAVKNANANLNPHRGKIPIAGDRTFSNFADEVFYFVGGGVKGYAAHALATYAKWNANIESTWESFDKHLVIYSPDDTTIPPAASLFQGLQKKGYFKYPCSDEHCFVFRGQDGVHARPFTDSEKAELGPRLRKLMQLT